MYTLQNLFTQRTDGGFCLIVGILVDAQNTEAPAPAEELGLGPFDKIGNTVLEQNLFYLLFCILICNLTDLNFIVNFQAGINFLHTVYSMTVGLVGTANSLLRYYIISRIKFH